MAMIVLSSWLWRLSSLEYVTELVAGSGLQCPVIDWLLMVDNRHTHLFCIFEPSRAVDCRRKLEDCFLL